MAKKGPEHDENEDGGEAAAAPAAKSGLKKILIATAGALLLVSISVGATLFVAGAFSKPAADDEDEAPAVEKKADKKDKKKKSAKDTKKGKEAAKPVAYLPLDPPFVINVVNQGNLRYVQVGLEAATREPGGAEDIKKHMPAIRNNMLMMLGGQNFEQAGSREMHEGIRAAALTEVQKVMQEQTGKPVVDAVYITSFVMQ